MKHWYFIIACTFIPQTSAMDLIRAQNNNFRSGIKHLRHEVRQKPYQYSFCSALYVSVSAASYYFVGTLPSLAIQAIITPMLLSVLSTDMHGHAQDGKREHFAAIDNNIGAGNFIAVTHLATRNQYDEQDPKNLEEQNTELLIEALYKYGRCINHDKANAAKHLQAASIFLTHHADAHRALKQLEDLYTVDHEGAMWLNQHLCGPKEKLR